MKITTKWSLESFDYSHGLELKVSLWVDLGESPTPGDVLDAAINIAAIEIRKGNLSGEKETIYDQ